MAGGKSGVAAAMALPMWAHVVVACVGVVLVGVLDHLTGPEIGFSIFYLAPVSFATWMIGRRGGMLTAIVSAVTWAGVEVTSGAVHSHPLIPVWNALVRLGFFAIIVWLLREMRQAHERERRMAQTDSLTGLANGRSFYAELDRELDRLRRYRRPFMLVYADLDRFKAANDTLGHAAGDELLKEIASRLAVSVRGIDTAARLGGDEFGVIMPEVDEAEAPAALRRVMDAACEPMKERLPDLDDAGATLGAVVFREAPDSTDEAVRMADEYMYAGKRGGPGRVVLGVYPDGRSRVVFYACDATDEAMSAS